MGEAEWQDRREEAARLYRSGLSERQVAERMGVSKTTARSYLNTAGVRRRRQGRPRVNRRKRSRT